MEPLTTISDNLPGRAVVPVVVVAEVELTTGEIIRVMCAWIVAAMLAGAWPLIGRDAT